MLKQEIEINIVKQNNIPYVPKVSVIVPVYNVSKYLHQCLDGIVHQTLNEIEIICIDDGSTDESFNILQNYASKDERMTVVHKTNSGYGHSMNIGLKLAKGEYIGIVESDDWVETQMFEKLYQKATLHHLDVVKSNFYDYWAEKDQLSQKVFVMPENDLNEVIRPQERQNIFWQMPCIWAAIYRRQFLEENDIQFLETPGASYQDTAFNFKVWALAHRVLLIDEAFLHYRRDNEQSSVNSKGKVFCIADEYHEIERFLKQKNMTHLLALMNRLKFSTYMWNYKRLCWPLNWHFLKFMSEEFKTAKHNGLLDKNLFSKEYRKIKKIISYPFLFFISSQLKYYRQKKRG